jgi:hypothetical protein
LRCILNQLRLTLFIRVGDYSIISENLNNDLRTDNCTQSTSGTLGVGGLGREIAAFIGFFGYDDATLRAYCYTEAAAFASFSINNNFASHFRILALSSRFVT